MAQESRNGSKPATQTASDESRAEDDGNGTPFERFERLTRHLLTVPKDEVDRRLKRSKRKPARSR